MHFSPLCSLHSNQHLVATRHWFQEKNEMYLSLILLTQCLPRWFLLYTVLTPTKESWKMQAPCLNLWQWLIQCKLILQCHPNKLNLLWSCFLLLTDWSGPWCLISSEEKSPEAPCQGDKGSKWTQKESCVEARELFGKYLPLLYQAAFRCYHSCVLCKVQSAAWGAGLREQVLCSGDRWLKGQCKDQRLTAGLDNSVRPWLHSGSTEWHRNSPHCHAISALVLAEIKETLPLPLSTHLE